MTENANFYALLQSRFPEDAAAPCLLLPGGGEISYGALDRATGQVAALLRGLGIEPGDRVTAQVAKSAETLFLYLGCLRAGAIFHPLNTAYTAKELAYFLGDAQPKLLVCDPARREALAPVAEAAGVAHLLDLDEEGQGGFAQAREAAEPSDEIARLAPDALAALIYTSGTTGLSKGAMLSHGNLAANALALYEVWGWRRDDVLLHALPIFHVHGLFIALHNALLGGSRIHWLPKFEPQAMLERLPKSTVMMGVPTFYTRLLEQEGLTPEVCAKIRVFISGSAPLLEETFTAWEERTGHRIVERYGMSEAIIITSNPLEGERKPGTVGYPLPGVELRIAHQQDRATPLPAGEIGLVEIRGPSVFAGYWNKPDKTAEDFVEGGPKDGGWFVTGDLGQLEPDGRLAIVGRSKDLIISGGYNVYPKEIELAIDAIPGVLESAVIGLPHPDWGEAVCACIVREKSAEGEALGEEAVLAALKDQLARFKQPKTVRFIEELPRNAMGKVQKNLLRDAETA